MARQRKPYDSENADCSPDATQHCESCEPSEFELSFTLEEEDSGMVLPFHYFRVLDASGEEIASGETDAEGEAVVVVDREDEFEIVPYKDAKHPLAGAVLSRGSLEPAAGLTVEAESEQGTRLSATTDAEGHFDFGAQQQGFWVLRIEDLEHPIYLDDKTGEVAVYVPLTEETPTPPDGED